MKTYLYVNFIQPPNSFVYTNCRVAFPLLDRFRKNPTTLGKVSSVLPPLSCVRQKKETIVVRGRYCIRVR